MIKKLFVLALLIGLLVSSCNPQSTAQPAIPTGTASQPPTETQAPARSTETPVPTETPATTPPPITSTVETPRPANDPNCTNSASFVADVTIPDNTTIGVGAPFTKTWRVRNTGTCIWAYDYILTYYSEERMGAPNAVSLPITYPNETADISVNLIAPNSTGTHRGNFVIKNSKGLIMKIDSDSRLWLVIQTTTDVSNATAVSGNDAGLVTSTCAFTSDISNVSETIDAINAYRAESGLPAYTLNSMLSKAAQSHANDMACNNLFGHTGSNGSSIQSRVADAGYVYSQVSENVYGSYPPLSGGGVVNWWKNDKTDLRHNLNLISDTFVDIGVGYSFFNNYGYYVVLFGTP